MIIRPRIATVVLVGLLLALGATAGSAVARTRTVVIPRVSGDVNRVYATLHRDGLTVTIARPFTLRSDRITRVTKISPAAGRRVRRGSAVTLTLSCCTGLGHLIRYGPRATVPTVTGYGLATARGWAATAQRRFLAHLAALRRANGSSLLANFIVTRQSPAANSTLGGASPLTVSARPGQPQACLPPLYGTVVASDSLASVSAVVGTETVNGNVGPGASYYGCVIATNHQVHLMTTISGNTYDSSLGKPVIAGTIMAAVAATGGGKYGSGPESFAVKTWDLTTGGAATVYAGGSDFIDQPVLNAAGDTGWHVVSVPTNAATALDEISCPTTSFCAAVDASGSVFTTTNPTGGRTAWSQTQLTTSSLSSISCPTATLCVATSGESAYVSSDPTGGASTWSAATIAPAQVQSVACPTITLCVAVTSSGVSTTANPTGPASAWQWAAVPGVPRSLNDVVCPSASLCAASDGGYGNVATSTNPSGGASTWSLADVDGTSALTGIGCASASLCVAGDGSGDVLSSTNPAGGLPAWQLSHAASTFFSHFSCPSTSLCAVGAPSAVLTSTSPTSSNPWSVNAINGAGLVNGISCPSTSLCVAVDNLGQVLTSGDPAGGGSAWTTTVVDAPACAASTGCKVERIMANDSTGVHTFDSTGPGDGTQLKNLALTDTQLSWTHNGTAEGATLK